MVTLTEKVESRQWSGGSVTLHYVLTGTSSDITAKTMLLAYTASTYDGLVRDSNVTLEPVWVDENAGDGEWACEVRYSPAPLLASQMAEPSYSFDTTGGTKHITQALATAKHAPAGKTAPDFKGAINVTKDAVEGVDIVWPVFAWSETHYIEDRQVTDPYKRTLFDLTGRINNALFRGCKQGECLFLGARGAERGGEPWEMNFSFAAKPNRENISLGDIAPFAAWGWHYVWVRYEDKDDTAAKVLVKTPLAAYVAAVYELGDFSALGIGT